MIYYLMLLLIPFASCAQSASQKQYNLKTKDANVILFSGMTSAIALCFYLITSRLQLDFDLRLLPYALGFSVCYAAAWAGTIFAVRFGPMAISSMIISCSLIFPTVYGVLLGEEVTPRLALGVVSLISAIVLVNLKFDRRTKFSWKWLLCTLVAFAGNGVCSLMTNMQKRALGDGYSHEFMILSLLFAAILLFGYAALTSKHLRRDFKAALPYASVNGVFNAFANFLMLCIIGNIPNTVLYPTNSALNMICTFLLAFVVYKERFSKPQYVGYAMGIMSIVLLNL